MARPTAASAAATAIEKIANRMPTRSDGFSENRQKVMKFRFAAPSINSIPMRIMIEFERESTAARPKANRIAEMARRIWSVMVLLWHGHLAHARFPRVDLTHGQDAHATKMFASWLFVLHGNDRGPDERGG